MVCCRIYRESTRREIGGSYLATDDFLQIEIILWYCIPRFGFSWENYQFPISHQNVQGAC